jgi:Fatty acid desaturase
MTGATPVDHARIIARNTTSAAISARSEQIRNNISLSRQVLYLFLFHFCSVDKSPPKPLIIKVNVSFFVRRFMFRYAHYALMTVLMLLNLGVLLKGGSAIWLGFVAAVALSTLVDEASGADTARAHAPPMRFLNSMLFLTLPLLTLNVLAIVLLFGTGNALGLVPALETMGIDITAARAHSSSLDLLGAIMGTGLFIGAAGTNVAHELVHRTHDRMAMLAGRWLLAFSFDTGFAIEHVYGHHRNVGTPQDPATARRGEYTLAFFLRSTFHGNISAARIESERLRRKGELMLSLKNRMITGQIMSLSLLLGSWLLAGGWGALAFVLAGIHGKLYLELVNYIEHYGLVRVPGARIEARHSWNTYHVVSSGLLYNLPRHSHHHLFAAKPFWRLEEEPEGPTYPYGYMTMIIISLVPPLWNRTVNPRLAAWDREKASEPEKALLAGLIQAKNATGLQTES